MEKVYLEVCNGEATGGSSKANSKCPLLAGKVLQICISHEGIQNGSRPAKGADYKRLHIFDLLETLPLGLHIALSLSTERPISPDAEENKAIVFKPMFVWYGLPERL